MSALKELAAFVGKWAVSLCTPHPPRFRAGLHRTHAPVDASTVKGQEGWRCDSCPCPGTLAWTPPLSVSPAPATPRSASPKHGFTIMNRLSMENRTEPPSPKTWTSCYRTPSSSTETPDVSLHMWGTVVTVAVCCPGPGSARVAWEVQVLGQGWRLPPESLDGDSVTVKVWVCKARPPTAGPLCVWARAGPGRESWAGRPQRTLT